MVVDQEVHARRASFEIPDNLACLLVNPGRVWMLGTACEVHATAAQLDEEKHIQRPQKESFDREKIARQDLLSIMAHEMAPTWRTAAFGSTWDAMASQNVGDGFVAKRDAQFGEFPCDLVVAPVAIFACQSHDEPFNFLIGTGTTALPVRLIGPLAAN